VTEKNRTIAKVFQEIADLLASRRENPYRVRAYHRAAEVILQLPDDLAILHERGTLREIPGIGRELSSKIEEFLTTGSIQTHRDLQSPLPAGTDQWSALPGLSPGLVHYLVGRLGIRTLDDLESLTRSHFLRTLPGFTASEDELLTAIERVQASQGRVTPRSDESP
jgi:DNA polymerase (family 10)